MRTLMVNKHC